MSKCLWLGVSDDTVLFIRRGWWLIGRAFRDINRETDFLELEAKGRSEAHLAIVVSYYLT